jgi:outer membrane receptor protein involved in Fe transport
MPNDFKTALLASAAAILAGAANAADFDIPGGDLKAALDSYSRQTGVSLLYSDQAIRGVRSKGVQGDVAPDDALSRILYGTGFQIRRHEGSAITIVRDNRSSASDIPPLQMAQAMPARSAVETVTVTSSKLGGADVQSIPIAITALSQEQLTATQTAGGPDLVKQVPNLTFTKTNFTGYSIQIRGIGTQAISVATDPAVAVAFNDIPFIRNHFFEQEFYDVAQVQVLRGPQGTLYGRNATAGVVNLTSAKPTDQFEAMASAELGNYRQRRFEGMINIPIVDDWLDIRLAGEWTKRNGYSFNEITNSSIDGRDLWSGRLSIGWKPTSDIQAYLIWEHFSENDDRIRSSKQLCKRDPGLTQIDGVDIPQTGGAFSATTFLSQGCLPVSLYSPEAFQVPNGFSLPYYGPLANAGAPLDPTIDPYADTVQSTNLRNIQSTLDPIYKAKNDIVELNADYHVTPSLTITSQTGFNHDFLWSTQDYNRFNTAPGIFMPGGRNGDRLDLISADGVFCDPQLGCSDRLVVQDLSEEHAWQFSQELRISSNFDGPFNFSFGGNVLHYETQENYYVFVNTVTLFAANIDNGFASRLWVPGVSDNHECLMRPRGNGAGGFQYPDPNGGSGALGCDYIDPNPLSSLNDEGHNYFLSQNPYVVNSYAGFGEAYYNVAPDLKFTAGLRFTEDRKHFPLIPSWLASAGYGYPIVGNVDQDWGKITGRFAANWTPKLDFTDQTLIYGSYAHGYKAGGANPPGPVLPTSVDLQPTHPLTFAPEYVDAFEIGSKNTLLDGALTLNGNLFYYNYKGYQISQIVDRTSVNLNFDAHIKGAELEATYEPVPGLRFNFGGGWEHTELADGSKAVDLMDRTAGHTDWVVVKPDVTLASNCVLPTYLLAKMIKIGEKIGQGSIDGGACAGAYVRGIDPVTNKTYVPNPTRTYNNRRITDGYPGFDPSTAPNGGAGFYKDLSGNELPNAPPFTVSFGAQYSMPVTEDWAATLRGDYYWQDYSWARVFNDNPYDRLRGYTNINLALILTSQNGWQVMGYLKNVLDTTAITGDFLNSDDTGLTTNVFLTDPRLIGVRVTKNW